MEFQSSSASVNIGSSDCATEGDVEFKKSVELDSNSKKRAFSPEASDGKNSKKLRTFENSGLNRNRIVLPSGSSSLSKVSNAEHAQKIRKRRFVEKRLALIHVKNAKRVSSCVKAAISNGHIKIVGSAGLDLKRKIHKGHLKCGHVCTATLADVLYQPDFVGVEQSTLSSTASVFCSEYLKGSCPDGWAYVTSMCKGKPRFDWTGQLVHHCNKCDSGVFGVCVDDYKSTHCPKCGIHYLPPSCPSCFPVPEPASGSVSSDDSEIY